jgi:hypothetical protein
VQRQLPVLRRWGTVRHWFVVRLLVGLLRNAAGTVAADTVADTSISNVHGQLDEARRRPVRRVAGLLRQLFCHRRDTCGNHKDGSVWELPTDTTVRRLLQRGQHVDH